tara:strand:+ start:2590 stop:4275 length:1686 start_codon:yes stop_codon:yes gene_type:complete
MAILHTDVSVASNGDIRWTGGATTYTVLELHRFLGSLADDASSINDDFVDITSDTPSDRSTDNIITLLGTYNIDDTMAEHLFDGSISQASGAELYSGLRVLGAVNNINTQLMVIQDNDLYQFTTIDTAPFWGDQSTGGFNGDAVSGILFRCLIKSRTGGVDIDGKRIRLQARHWGDTYDFFNVTLGQGESVAALGTTPDAQNTTVYSAVTGYTHTINSNEGYNLIDLNNGNGAQPYYSLWTYGADTSGDGLKGVWEYIKYASGNGTGETLYGQPGELFLGVTHEIGINTPTGTWQEPEVVGWSGGTANLLAIDSTTAGTVMWVQLLTGVLPVNEAISGVTSSATAFAFATASKTVPKTFLGSYTGSLIGAFGVGVDSGDLVATDTIQDLSGNTQIPPNNVTFTVSSLVAVEDRILVGPRLAGVIEIDQMSALSTVGAGAATVVMSAPIPVDTPSTGTFRLLGDLGVYNRLQYSGYTSATFSLSGETTPDDVTAGANAYVSYIDKDVVNTGGTESFTTIFNTSRDLFIRVRDGKATPIKTFESAGTLGAAGGSTVASRITDE